MVGTGSRKARAISSGFQAAEGVQREGDLRLGRQGRMAARKNQAQPVIGDFGGVVIRLPPRWVP